VDNQVSFLTKFWHQHSELKEKSQKLLERYATALIKVLAISISDKEKEFTGIPLQTRLLAEAFEEKVKTYCLSQKSDSELLIELRLVDLYGKFITEKINIFKSKGKVAETQLNDIIKFGISINKNHQELALEVQLPELKDTVLELQGSDVLEPEVISGIGIVQYVDGKPYFVHRTLAEFYVADFLATEMTKETHYLLEILNILFNIILGSDFVMIRFFLNELLVIPVKQELLKEYGNEICKLWNEKWIYKLLKIKKSNFSRRKLTTALSCAVKEGNDHIVDFFFCSLKVTKKSGIIKKLLLNARVYEGTLWHLATKGGHKHTLEALWRWGREVQVNLKDDLLLSKDWDGYTAWVSAAERGNKEILEKLWKWGREVGVNLKDDLLLAKDRNQFTTWFTATQRGHKEILEKLWCWGRELKVNLKDDLLPSKDGYGFTAWVKATQRGDKEILEKLWCWGRESQVNLKDDLLLSKDRYGYTVWDTASKRGDKEMLEKLWCWGRESQVNLKDDLLLAKDRNGCTAWV
jgi:hypothetical protein